MFQFRRVGLLVFLALSTSLPAPVPAPRAVRAVQVAAAESGEEARGVVDRVEVLLCQGFHRRPEGYGEQAGGQATGFGPVWVREEGGFVKVLVGRCERLPDAVLLKQALRRHGFADAFERAFPDLVTGDFETEAWTPEPPLLGPPSGASLRVYTENDVRADWRVGEFEEFLRGGQDAEAIVAARRLVAGLSDDDALKGRVMVRAGRAMVRHSRQTGEAVPLLLAVARGEVAATEADRLEARWLVADSWHYFDFAPLRAYAGYREILLSEGEKDEGVRARALVEIAACLLELAQMEQAYYNEVRRVCAQIRHTVAPEFERAHAVADLLHCESFLFEGDKAASLAAFRGFEARHPRRPRELSMAHHMQGWLLAELGRWDEAVGHFERNLELSLDDPSEGFYWRGERWNMRRLSAKWLLHYAGKAGDAERQRRYAAYVDGEKFDEGVPALDPREFDFHFPHEFYEQRAPQPE